MSVLYAGYLVKMEEIIFNTNC